MYVQCFFFLPYYITIPHCPNTFSYKVNSDLLFSVDQPPAPSFEITCRALFLENVMRGGELLASYENTNTMEMHNRIQKANLLTPFHTTEQSNTYTYKAYVKVGRVQEHFASHISCMTAFNHRGWLDQEVRSYLCEVLTAKCRRNGTEYVLALLWHHVIKQMLWINGSLICEPFWHMCEQTSLTGLWFWRDNGSVKTMTCCDINTLEHKVLANTHRN